MSIRQSFSIKDWASSKIYRRGLAYYHEDRVISFDVDDEDNILAEVEGSEIYTVEIKRSNSGHPYTKCSCPYDWEPLCKHAVAALLYWQAGGGNDGYTKDEKADANTASADVSGDNYCFNREQHIDEIAALETKKRCLANLLGTIKIIERPKDGGLYGTFRVSSGTYDHDYYVMVRDVHDLSQTICNCPDYLFNELSTCKHIELVKKHVGVRSKRKKWRGQKNRSVWIALKPRNTSKSPFSPFEEIHIHSADPDIRQQLFSKPALAKKLWDKDGYLVCSGELAREKFSVVLDVIKGLFKYQKFPEIFVSRGVKNLIVDIDEESEWAARMDKIIASPGKSKEWVEFKNTFPMKLYDYQEEGVLFAARNMRVFLGDDMGLGKTVQAIAVALFLKKIAGIKKVLIFAPASLKFQWKREIEKVSGEKAVIICGNRLKRKEIYEKSNEMFLIINYELIFRDMDLLNKVMPDMVILDEAQRIKNWATKTAKWIKRLESRFALALTGTPFENRLLELHSLCEFLRPRVLGPMWRLMPTYADLDAHDKVIGYSNLSDLRQKLSPFFIRRERNTVQNQLPEKVANEYLTEISSIQRKYHDDYQATLAQILGRMKKRPLTQQEMLQVFACLSAMRIISNAYAQHDWEKYKRVVESSTPLSLPQIKNLHSPKLLEFRSVMEELLEKPKAKFVIFSQWERMLKLAEATIRDVSHKNGAESVIFSGSLPSSQRPAVIDRFINDPRLRMFFSTDAGGLGLNLQEAASFVINLELPWNPGVLDQRISRVHRLGQKNTVNVINFISTDCIEERVYGAIANKRALFDGVFDDKTDSISLDKGSEFIGRLTEMIGENVSVQPVQTDDGEKGLPMVEHKEKTLDLAGIVKSFGAWVGNNSLAGINTDSLKVKVEEDGDEIKLRMSRPPKEFISGIKDVFASLFGGGN